MLPRMPLPSRIRARRDDRRWRRAVRMDFAPEVTNRLWADGYRFAWRVSQGMAMGHTFAGDDVEIPFEEFIKRYLAADSA